MATQFSVCTQNFPHHKRSHIVIVDSDPLIRSYLERILSDRFELTLVSHPQDLSALLTDSRTPDLVLLDWMPGANGPSETALNLLGEIVRSSKALPVVLLSCSSDPNDILTGMRLGATDVLPKPFSRPDIDGIVDKYLALPLEIPMSVSETALDDHRSFVRCNSRMRQIESHCSLVAKTDIPVLLLGESGTGKEIAAMFMHKSSSRSEHTFLKVNCAAMPLDLLESELFGYEQGAFTGAMKSKPGKFELCNHGTIFLDEVGEMPTALQAKLLHVLQDGTFSRLGARGSIKVDVRVIAATNINIKEAIREKRFREDLFYRLNGFGIEIPPLRERRDEIPILAKYFMRRSAARYDREPLQFSETLMQALVNYEWPGNLRELENTIRRFLVLKDESAVMREIAPQGERARATSTLDATAAPGLKGLVRGVKGDAEAAAIAQTLQETRWNRKAAASMLQISYKALLYKIKQYQLVEQRVM